MSRIFLAGVWLSVATFVIMDLFRKYSFQILMNLFQSKCVSVPVVDCSKWAASALDPNPVGVWETWKRNLGMVPGGLSTDRRLGMQQDVWGQDWEAYWSTKKAGQLEEAWGMSLINWLAN